MVTENARAGARILHADRLRLIMTKAPCSSAPLLGGDPIVAAVDVRSVFIKQLSMAAHRSTAALAEVAAMMKVTRAVEAKATSVAAAVESDPFFPSWSDYRTDVSTALLIFPSPDGQHRNIAMPAVWSPKPSITWTNDGQRANGQRPAACDNAEAEGTSRRRVEDLWMSTPRDASASAPGDARLPKWTPPTIGSTTTTAPTRGDLWQLLNWLLVVRGGAVLHPSIARDLFVQLIAALQFVHDVVGISHGDIKMENITFTISSSSSSSSFSSSSATGSAEQWLLHGDTVKEHNEPTAAEPTLSPQVDDDEGATRNTPPSPPKALWQLKLQLIDFGMCASDDDASSLRQVGGTKCCLSPELWRLWARTITHRRCLKYGLYGYEHPPITPMLNLAARKQSDVFAAACVLRIVFGEREHLTLWSRSASQSWHELCSLLQRESGRLVIGRVKDPAYRGLLRRMLDVNGTLRPSASSLLFHLIARE